MTKAQKEYFKDSKIRDSKGNLIVCYHGTDNNFNNFSNVKTEPGFWFTEDKEYASTHGENLLKVYLNVHNPYIIEEEDLLESLTNCYNKEIKNDFDEKIVLSNNFRRYLESKGYDALIWEHSGFNTIVTFKPEQIKSVNNKYPTKSPVFTDNKEEYLAQSKTLDSIIKSATKKTGSLQKENTSPSINKER